MAGRQSGELSGAVKLASLGGIKRVLRSWAASLRHLWGPPRHSLLLTTACLAAGLVLQVVAVRSCNAWAAVLAAALLVRGGYEIEDPRDPPEHVWGPRVPRRSSRLFTTSNLAAALFFEWATIHWCTGWAAVLAAAFLFRAGFEIPPPNDQQV